MINYFKTLNWLKLGKILIILIIVYAAAILAICFFKYYTFGYNALDLAIFNQVFYNSSIGKLFQFTIHPTSYLGDHFELIIFLLVPFYSVFKSPLTLLVIQTLFLALAVIPLYLIAKKYLTPLQTLLILLLYLFNPVTWNINLFEFHILAIAPFFIFWTFYFYDQNKFKPFLVFLILSLLIREDVSFVVFMFGLIAILDKKRLKWILTPLILASLYFLAALKIVGYFSAAKTYKFLVYYQWLGQTLPEIFKNFFLKFPLVLQHVFTFADFELILGFLLVFLFLPLYRPKYLLLSLGMFLQIILGFASGELILRTHYGALFLSAISLAAIFALKALAANQRFSVFFQRYKDLIILLVCTGLIYNFLLLGPVPTFAREIFQTDYQAINLRNEFIKKIPKNASLVTTYDLIANLSSREKLYSLNYAFLGRQQYGAGEYKIPENTQFVLINFDDFITFHLQYERGATKYYYQGADNLDKIIAQNNFKLIWAEKNLALWQKDSSKPAIDLYQIYEEKLPEIKNPQSQILNNQLEFLGINQGQNSVSLFFKALNKLEKNYFIKINEKNYPLGYGLYPTSQWQTGQILGINFFGLPRPAKIQILNLSGRLEMDGLGSTKDVFDKIEVIGEINLD